MRFFEKSRAVISVFLIIVMMPLLGLAVVLVDGSRVRSAKMMVQEASDLAAMSTLAGYNNDLKNDYGLFAIKDADNAGSVFESILKSSLTAATGGDETYSDMIYNTVKDHIFSDTKITGFTDFFNYSIGNSSVQTLYNLDQKEVLQNQIVEYTKYRGVYFLADRLSLLANIGELKSEYEDTKKSAELMEKKLSLDEEASKNVEDKITELNTKISEFHTSASNLQQSGKIDTFKSTARSVLDAAEAAYDRHIDDEEWDQDRSVAFDVYAGSVSKSGFSDVCDSLDDMGKEMYDKFNAISVGDINELLSNIESEKTKLNNFINNEVNGSSATTAEEMKKDAQDTIARYDKYKKKLENLKAYMNGSEYSSDKELLNMSKTMYGNAYSAICSSLLSELNSPSSLKAGVDSENGTAEPLKYCALVKTGGEFRHDGMTYYEHDKATGNYYGTYNDGCPYYSDKCIQIANKFNLINLDAEEAEDHRDEAENAINSANNKTDSYTGSSIPDSEYSLLPSKGTPVIDNVKTEFSTDADKITEDTHSILSQAGDYLAGLAETTRDEALTFTYIFGMFKTRMSDSSRFSSSQKPSSWSDYHVKWRYENDDGEHNLREKPKSSMDTVLNAEVEYIFGGNKSDAANCASVYAWIYGTRVVNNIISIYSNSSARNQCLELASVTAAAVAAATLGVVTLSPTVYQWIYITAWAVSETSNEMDFLVNDGYRIPLIKTSKNLMIQNFSEIANQPKMLSNLNTNIGKSFINVTYEDYLLILLCLMTDSDTRVRRIADLVQLNMRKRHDSGFLMSKAPTYLKADTQVSINFLFQQISQFAEFYNVTGITFKNTVYQGY